MTRQPIETASARSGVIRLDAVDRTFRELYLNDRLLASTAHVASSALLADLALAGVAPQQKHAEVLIGGLGVGLVLRRVLLHPAVQRVWVVESHARVVTWNRDHLGNADLLDDPRVELVVGDFADYAQGVPRNYNGIAMHIDTGPEHPARSENRRSYSLSMLKVLQMRLRSGSALAIYAQQPSSAYERALREIFEHVALETATDQDADGEAHTCVIYQARM